MNKNSFSLPYVYARKQRGGCSLFLLDISAFILKIFFRYCAKLPADMATNLTAKWCIKETDPESNVKEYECTLKMPINSSLRAPIVVCIKNF